MNYLFDKLTYSDHPLGLPPNFRNILWAPEVKLKESNTNLILEALLLGIEVKDLDIHVSESAVSIVSERHEEECTH